MFSRIWEFLNQNYVGVIISLIVSYIFYKRALPHPRLAFQRRSSRFPDKGTVLPSEVEIVFRGKSIPHVMKTSAAIWNCGNTTIKSDQIVDTDPLRISFSPDTEVLDASILSTTRRVNEFKVQKKVGPPNEVECTFDYLDPNDGVIVNVLHTGDENVKILGTIRQMPKGVMDLKELTPHQSITLAHTFFGITLILSSLFIAWELRSLSPARALHSLSEVSSHPLYLIDLFFNLSFGTFLLFVLFGLSLFGLLGLRRRLPRRLHTPFDELA